MINNWKKHKLGNFLNRRYDSIIINDLEKYKRVTIKTKGQGIDLRDIIFGSEIGTKNQYKIKENQFLLSKIDAMNGAFGIVPNNCNNGIITGNFWTYDIDDTIIDKYYLKLLVKQQVFTNFSIEASEGSTNRKYLREDKFLNLSISLPPLSEQKRIVEKIESVQKQVEQIRKLRAEQEKEIMCMFYSIYEDCFKKYKKEKIGKVLEQLDRYEKKDNSINYTFSGTYSFGRGIFRSYTKQGCEFNLEKIQRIYQGDFIFCKIMAWEGAFGIAPKECNNTVMSGAFVVYNVKKNLINPKFLENFFQIEGYWKKIGSKSTGTNVRRKTLSAEDFESYEVPLPSLAEQNRIVSFLEKLNQIRQTFKTQEKELTELLPSLLHKAFKGELVVDDNQIPTVKNNELESNSFIKRKMLGTYIINQSLDDDKFGDVKFQKLFYLSECFVIKRNFGQKYYVKAAGPYDNHFTFNFYDQVTKAGWFDIQKNVVSNVQTKITAGKNNDKSRKNYGYFSAEELAKVDALINYFKKSDYEQPEIIATLYAVWNNRKKKQEPITDELLKEDFLNWDKKKLKYKDRLDNALNWMRKKGIVPDGWGEVIEKTNKKKSER